jgi:hypothetical protein
MGYGTARALHNDYLAFAYLGLERAVLLGNSLGGVNAYENRVRRRPSLVSDELANPC